jgi:hypothetical protein
MFRSTVAGVTAEGSVAVGARPLGTVAAGALLGHTFPG